VVANFPGNKLPGYLQSVPTGPVRPRNTDGHPPTSKNRELAKFDASVIALTRLTLYHRNLSSMKNPVSVISAVLLFSCATLFQAKAATIDLPLYGFQIDALDAAPDASAPATALETFYPRRKVLHLTLTFRSSHTPGPSKSMRPYPKDSSTS
jgi:hypothetical protein